jgi:hypothetical protein
MRFKKEGWDIDHIEGTGKVFAEYELSPDQMGGQLKVPDDFKVVGKPTI